MHFIRVPQITWPLICIFGVIFFTAKFTGGFGLRAFGSDIYGGQKYIFLLIGVLSYFALTSRHIPLDKARFYVALFFLGETAKCIGDFFSIAPSWAHFVFWFFPPNLTSFNAFDVGQTRLGGIGAAGVAVCYWLVARYGLRGILLPDKLWRPVLFAVSFAMIFLGGFRSAVFTSLAVLAVMFFMEGLHRTRLLPALALAGIMAMIVLVPLASHLPFTFQRALAFLPLDLSTEARIDAGGSSGWRVAMWTALMPQVPKYLLLGKGLAIRPEDYNEMMGNTALSATTGSFDPSQDPMALSYDYHNGMLSVLIPFGIWGLIAYLWFMAAGLSVLYRNWKYGNPELRSVNTLLFAVFLFEFVSFLSCYAGLALPNGIPFMVGRLGLSIALNNGVCQPPPQPAQTRQPFNPARPFPSSRPAFQQ